MTTTINNGIKTIEIEKKVGECEAGTLIGELAMTDHAPRALSAMTKTNCVFLILNKEAFDILLKGEIKKMREAMATFLLEHFPNLKE
jgi:CRP-like cAMP-binding protein